MSEDWTLVTGASGGIGAALAEVAARAGHRVILAARSADRLEELAERLAGEHGIGVMTVPVDLADPDGPATLWEEATAEGRHVAFLANNAGLGRYGQFAEGGWAQESQSLAVNVLALTELTKLAVPAMVAAGAGRILNIASLGGMVPVPGMAVYNATKAYVISFSETLAEELRGTGVSVTVVCPGVTDTNFQAVAGMTHLKAVERGPKQSAEEVAAFAFRAAEAGRRMAVPGALNKGAMIAARTLPRRLLAWGAARAMS